MKSLYIWGLAAPGSEGAVDGASPRGFLRFLSLTGPADPRVEVPPPEAAMSFFINRFAAGLLFPAETPSAVVLSKPAARPPTTVLAPKGETTHYDLCVALLLQIIFAVHAEGASNLSPFACAAGVKPQAARPVNPHARKGVSKAASGGLTSVQPLLPSVRRLPAGPLLSRRGSCRWRCRIQSLLPLLLHHP